MAAAARRFRRDAWLVAWEQDEQATLGAGVCDRDPQERLDELTEDDLAGYRLRGLEHRPDIQLLDGRANGSGGRRRDWRIAALRMKLFELPHLAERTPAQVTVPRVPQAGVGDRSNAARRIEPRGQLMGQAFVLHETVLASRPNGLLVQTHGVGLPPFEAGYLGRHQGVFVAERRWIDVGPLAQLFPVRSQEVEPPGLLVGRRVLIERRHRQGGVVKVVE